ncbi:MAG: hypothetical protein LBF27_07090 [Sphingobacterium sp.]|jgi:phenylacetate-CoA ligase|nr:hypothetical protein [Sphingobacterium sp.]
MKEKIYNLLPVFFQELLITVFNFLAYKKRYGHRYSHFRQLFLQNRNLTILELKEQQLIRFDRFLNNAVKNSNYYSNYNIVPLNNIESLPIVSKEDLRLNLDSIYTISKKRAILSKTGGTTGKSLEVFYTEENMQERFAMLDDFRSRYGYELGKRTAWFSGKKLLTRKDILKNHFWKTDRLHKVRYYSTFHIKEEYLLAYVENLIKYSPEYIVGFPSSIMEIAKFGLRNELEFPAGTLKAIFPTAETITVEMRLIIEKFFKAKMYNQYASSEGAPFIFECNHGKLHMELQSGVFEVLDDNNIPTKSGKLVVTSFTTDGTPLIRYDIGDSIELADEDDICECGNANPIVRKIIGRIDDYVYSPENGKINLGNVSNTLKEIDGIIRFQVVQNDLHKIQLLIVRDHIRYNDVMERKFVKNWRDRIGPVMELDIKYVESIPVEKSGKYRIVKNNIKHLLD